jgi:threonine/homoserine/homoserine lactone efflux protein
VVAMVDFLFTLGQIASALFLAYGGILILMPAKKMRHASSDEMRVMHLRMHA